MQGTDTRDLIGIEFKMHKWYVLEVFGIILWYHLWDGRWPPPPLCWLYICTVNPVMGMCTANFVVHGLFVLYLYSIVPLMPYIVHLYCWNTSQLLGNHRATIVQDSPQVHIMRLLLDLVGVLWMLAVAHACTDEEALQYIEQVWFI